MAMASLRVAVSGRPGEWRLANSLAAQLQRLEKGVTEGGSCCPRLINHFQYKGRQRASFHGSYVNSLFWSIHCIKTETTYLDKES